MCIVLIGRAGAIIEKMKKLVHHAHNFSFYNGRIRLYQRLYGRGEEGAFCFHVTYFAAGFQILQLFPLKHLNILRFNARMIRVYFP